MSLWLSAFDLDRAIDVDVDVPDQALARPAGDRGHRRAVIRDLFAIARDALLGWLSALVIDDEVVVAFADEAVDAAFAVWGEQRNFAAEELGVRDAEEGVGFRDDSEPLADERCGRGVDALFGGERFEQRLDRRAAIPDFEDAMQQDSGSAFLRRGAAGENVGARQNLRKRGGRGRDGSTIGVVASSASSAASARRRRVRTPAPSPVTRSNAIGTVSLPIVNMLTIREGPSGQAIDDGLKISSTYL